MRLSHNRLFSIITLIRLVAVFFGMIFSSNVDAYIIIEGVPLATEPRHFFNNFTPNEDIATKFEADLPHCVRNVKEKNVLLFKFRCNIFIGVRIIKEMSGPVASGTPCSCDLSQFNPLHKELSEFKS